MQCKSRSGIIHLRACQSRSFPVWQPEEELVEVEGRGELGIEPDRGACRLAELVTFLVDDEGQGDAPHLVHSIDRV